MRVLFASTRGAGHDVLVVGPPVLADTVRRAGYPFRVGAGLVVEPQGEGAIRSAVDPAALHDAIVAVLADETFPRAAGVVAAEIRELPPVDAALDLLEAAR